MDIFAISGLLGTVLSIATFFMPEKWRSKKITLILFLFCVAALSGIIVNQNSRLTRINQISKAANVLTNSRSMDFTHEGYIQAGLAFLEQNKAFYPESYGRAVAIYDKYKLLDPVRNNAVDLAFEMDGLIKGISILNQER